MDPKLFPDLKCRLLLVGKTGNGKSSTGNSILGYKAFDPEVGINSGTQDGNLQSGDCEGVNLQVMDTPGLCDTEADDKEICGRITRSLLAISPGPHALILCLSCEQRFTKQEMDVVRTLKHALGEHLMSYFVVVMVKRDMLETHNVSFEDQLEKCTVLKQFMAAINNRYVLFDNRPELENSQKKEQRQCLLLKVMEIVRANDREPFRHRLSEAMDNSWRNIIKIALAMPRYLSTPDAGQDAPEPPPEEEEPDDYAPDLSQTLVSLQKRKLVGKGVEVFESRSQDPHRFTEENAASLPPSPSSKRHPGRVAPAAEGNQSPKVPPKPPRVKPYQRAERERDDQLRETSNGNSRNRAAEMEQGGSAPSRSINCEVPDRSGMTIEDRQVMVEDNLRQMLARGGKLTGEQEEEVGKVSRSLSKKIREGMRKFGVNTLSLCRLM